jgi:hypothetical protein
MSYVRKLDDPKEFDQIKTGIKTKQSLKKMKPIGTLFGTITSKKKVYLCP